MKLNKNQESEFTTGRREFLKRGATASAITVGAALVPSIAMAETRFSECVEVAPDNAETFTTTCRYCMVQCGYKVKVWERGTGKHPKGEYAAPLSGEWLSQSFVKTAHKDGKPVYIAVMPDKDCVINHGDHSVRGGTNAQTLFNKDEPLATRRLTHPMIRKGGKNKPLVKVSWEEAIAFTAENMQRIRDKHGPDALGMQWGDWLYSLPTHVMLKFWFKGVGSSSYAGNGWFFDEESSGVSHALGSGTRSFTVQDFDQTELLVTAGTNLMADGSVWYNRFYMNDAGAKQIVVDPRVTNQARHAVERGGMHLKIIPGTDAYLFSAIMGEIIRKNGYDKPFVKKYFHGFNALKKVALSSKFSLKNASKITGISVKEIREAASLMMKHQGKSMFLHEKGIMHQLGAFQNQHSFVCLGLMLGNIGKPGATTSRAGGHPGGTWAWPKEPKSREHNKDLLKGLREGKVKLMWALATNVFKQIPDLNRHIPLISDTFFIVQDSYETQMNEAADVVFPAATWGEVNAVMRSEDRRTRINQKFMDAPGEARPDWEIIASVAKKLGYKGFDWKSDKEVWDEIRSVSGDAKDITWEMLENGGTNGIQLPYVKGKSIARLYSDEMEKLLGKRFFTKDNKIHVEEMELVGKINLKKFEWGTVNSKYPLMAFDFRLDELWNTGYTYWDKPTVNQRTRDSFVLIHPSDAKTHGIENKKWVKITSTQGSCQAIAKVTKDVVKGSIGVVALFPKLEQEFNNVCPSDVSPINGEFVTMTGVNISLV